MVYHREAYRGWLIQGTQHEGTISSDSRVRHESREDASVEIAWMPNFTGAADPQPTLDFVVCHREAYKGMADPDPEV